MDIMEEIASAARTVGVTLGDTWEFWVKMFQEQGDTALIDAARDKWTAGEQDSVKKLIGDAQSLTEEEAKVVSGIWDGPASDAFYVYSLGIGDKFDALRGICDGIAEALDSYRETLDQFWMWTWIVLGAAAVYFALCIASIWIAGIGAAALIAGLLALITAMVLYLTQISTTVESIRSAINTLQDQTATNSFPKGKFPRPKLDLSDGSVTDGDDSDWEPA